MFPAWMLCGIANLLNGVSQLSLERFEWPVETDVRMDKFEQAAAPFTLNHDVSVAALNAASCHTR